MNELASRRLESRSGTHVPGPRDRIVTALVILLLLASASCSAPGERPARSIVLIIVDTLRADRLGAYGFPAETSPEIDAYSDRGVRFEFALAQATWTRPSIASLLTSQLPRTLGIYNEIDEILDPSFETLAERLRTAGYTTLGATANPNINTFYGFDQGFDRYIDSDVLMEWMPEAAGFGADPRRRGKDGHWLPSASEVFSDLLEAAGEHGEAPYYLQANVMEVHEFHDARFVPEGDAAGDFAQVRDARERRYRLAIRRVSREIESFVRALEQRPGFEDMLVVITSDHGETLNDHPALAEPKWHGHLVYESHARVPLILYSPDPDFPRGRVVTRPVRLLDLMPTLLDYARASPPAGLFGTSLRPLIDGADDLPLPEHFVVETRLRRARKIAVYTPRWKYIENRDGHEGTNPRALQRIGVAEDGGRTDVASEHPETVERLAAALAHWEREHPAAPPSLAPEAPSRELTEQLRQLGYVD